MRAFIAIEVPYIECISEVQRAIKGRVKLVEPENMHLTLKFLGEVSDSKIPMIRKCVEQCSVPKFIVHLKSLGFFPSERYIKVVWIGVEDDGHSVALMRCIDSKLKLLGFKKEKSYVPHVTIARVKGKIDKDSLAQFMNTEYGKFVAKEIKIKKSILTDKGPIYENLAVISLG